MWYILVISRRGGGNLGALYGTSFGAMNFSHVKTPKDMKFGMQVHYWAATFSTIPKLLLGKHWKNKKVGKKKLNLNFCCQRSKWLYQKPLIFFTYSYSLIHMTVDFSHKWGMKKVKELRGYFGALFEAVNSSYAIIPILIKFGM